MILITSVYPTKMMQLVLALGVHFVSIRFITNFKRIHSSSYRMFCVRKNYSKGTPSMTNKLTSKYFPIGIRFFKCISGMNTNNSSTVF